LRKFAVSNSLFIEHFFYLILFALGILRVEYLTRVWPTIPQLTAGPFIQSSLHPGTTAKKIQQMVKVRRKKGFVTQYCFEMVDFETVATECTLYARVG
jgi:hypothetical protein